MNLTNYKAAKRYAEKVKNGVDPLDTVHDAYIRWYNKNGKDLFDEANGTVISVVRNVIFNQYEKDHQYVVNGEKRYRAFSPVEDAYDLPLSSDPLSETMAVNLLDIVSSNFKTKQDFIFVFDRLVEGHRQVDIAEELGVTAQYVGWIIANIRQITIKYLFEKS
jgi:hypothetical protein